MIIIKMLYSLGMIGMGVQGGPIGAVGGISSGIYVCLCIYSWSVFVYYKCVGIYMHMYVCILSVYCKCVYI
jgi:hypothetical protein